MARITKSVEERRQEIIDRYGTLFASLKENQGALEYFNKKMSMSSESFLLSLIQLGNEDGSWYCEYPKETARFILQGINGVVGLFPQNQDVDQKKQVLNNIVLRTLGVKAQEN